MSSGRALTWMQQLPVIEVGHLCDGGILAGQGMVRMRQGLRTVGSTELQFPSIYLLPCLCYLLILLRPAVPDKQLADSSHYCIPLCGHCRMAPSPFASAKHGWLLILAGQAMHYVKQTFDLC